MFDCRFVEADVFDGVSLPPDNFTAWDADARTGFGFISYQDASGNCMIEIWANDMDELESNHNKTNGNNVTGLEEWDNYVENYMDWLGEDWERARYYLGFALGASFVVFVWIIAMMCIAHVWGLRMLAAAIPFFGIMPLQFASLSVLNSDFCEERRCDLDRSGVGAICAGSMFFAGGIALLFTKSYSPRRDEEIESEPESYRQGSPGDPAGVEMVEIVEDASFVIEDDRAQENSNQVEEVVIGDGLAEALEIKPDMIFLHEDGDDNDNGMTAVHQSPPSAAAASAQEVIPTVTDVLVVDELSKTKVAP